MWQYLAMRGWILPYMVLLNCAWFTIHCTTSIGYISSTYTSSIHWSSHVSPNRAAMNIATFIKNWPRRTSCDFQDNMSSLSSPIEVHKYAKDPQKAWDTMKAKQKQKKRKVKPLSLDTPVFDDKIRFVCVSDTHCRLNKVEVPPGDVLLHAGDFSHIGCPKEVAAFNECLGECSISMVEKFQRNRISLYNTVVQLTRWKTKFWEISLFRSQTKSENLSKSFYVSALLHSLSTDSALRSVQ